MTTFYTADTHAFHKSIIHFEDGRGHYSDEIEMTEDIIKKWNDTVSKNDNVYHLGDVSFGGVGKLEEFLSRINGKITLIRGNHDHSKDIKKVSHLLVDVQDFISLKRNKQKLLLCHYPIDLGVRRKMWSIHGHIHSNLSRLPNQINVGIDSPLCANATMGKPITEEKLLEEIESVEYRLNYEGGYDRNRLYE